jgi:LPXTG-site transpeptidase (sortase) family protein
LKTLKYGDQVNIHAFGMVYTYEVTEKLLITNANVKMAFKHEDKPAITLLACEGYQEDYNTYAYRRIVRAILVSITTEK